MPSGSGSASQTGIPVKSKSCGCDCCASCANEQPHTSPEPVRYGDGSVILTETDLASQAFGLGWGHSRSYGNLLSSNSTGWNGNSWLVAQVERLALVGDSELVVSRTPDTSLWFTDDSGWVAQMGEHQLLEHDSTAKRFLLDSEDDGMRRVFFDFDSVHGDKAGMLEKIISPGGIEGTLNYDGSGRIVSFVATDGTGVVGYEYAYHDPGNGKLAMVSETIEGTTIRRVSYQYYGAGEEHGSFGDLKSVAVEARSPVDGEWTVIRNRYYRYYTDDWYVGFPHGLRFVVGPEAYSRMVAAGIPPESATSGEIQGYADNEFGYDDDRRVIFETVDGGARTYTFTYEPSIFDPAYDAWRMKTTMLRPDGTSLIVYTNYVNQVMLTDLYDGTDNIFDYSLHNSDSRLIKRAGGKAIVSYSDTYPDLGVTFADTGMARIYTFYASDDLPNGAVEGHLEKRQLLNLEGGTVDLALSQWLVREPVPGKMVVKKWKETVYRSDSGDGSPATTEYEYDFYGTTLQVEEMTVILPVVPGSENGDDQTYERKEVYDLFGRVTWSCDELGYITHRSYVPPTGAPLRMIQDVDTEVTPGAPAGWITPMGGGLNLATDYESDLMGRLTQVLGPVHPVDLDGTSVLVRSATFTVYRDDIDEVWTAPGYATGCPGGYGYTTVGPVSITRRDRNDRIIDEIKAAVECTGRINCASAFEQQDYASWTRSFYSNQGEMTTRWAYFDIPASGDGLKDSNYNEMTYGYDAMGRQIRVVSGGGTITRSVLDARGLVEQTWVGTNDVGATDSDPDGSSPSSGNNMLQVSGATYDKDGLPTTRTSIVDIDPLHDRETIYSYDWRNRLEKVERPENQYEKNTFDNLDRVIVAERYYGDPDASGFRTAKGESFYDKLGRTYRQKVWGVSGSSDGNSIEANVWYDGAGRLITTMGLGEKVWTKNSYDGIGRLTASFLSYPDDDVYDGTINDVVDDIVISQTENEYDAASNLIEIRNFERFHDATDTGALNGPDSAQPKSRIYFTRHWADAIGRNRATADYGTNPQGDSRPATVPASTDIVLVSSVRYDGAGRVAGNADPAGTLDSFAYDDMGRQIRVVSNVREGESGPDKNNTKEFSYNADGNLALLIWKNDVTGDQVTSWEYGTEGTGTELSTTLFLRAKVFPGSAGGSDQVAYTYNRQGEPTSTLDQNATVHDYSYDKLGRLTDDRATIPPGSAVDDRVVRIGTAYNPKGLVSLITSYASGDVVVNQVQLEYNPFNQLAHDLQEHDGEVHGFTPSVIYSYQDGSSGTIFPIQLTYPGAIYTVDLAYGSGGIDEKLGRILHVKEGSTNLASYSYLGTERAVIVDYHAGVQLTYLKQGAEVPGDAGDQYNGLDRFGRVQDHRWIATSGSSDVERIKYGYDRASLKQWRQNTVAASGHDDYYGYDGLEQVKERDQGTLNINRTAVSAASVEEDWSYDPSGNWDNYQRIGGPGNVDQDRTHTKVNEIATFDGLASPVAYDPAGNMTRIPADEYGTAHYEATWDAWNRLVRLRIPGGGYGSGGGSGSGSGSALDLTYHYDGLTRRIRKTNLHGGSPVNVDYFWNKDWKCVQERDDFAATPSRQYIYGARGRNDLILGDDWTGSRYYALCDAMGSKTAITNDTGTVVERYEYSAFGMLSVMAPDFSPRSVSEYDWNVLFHGETRDSDTGLYNYGYRYYLPQLGRWASRDPIEELGSLNLYGFVANRATAFRDHLGLSLTLYSPVCVARCRSKRARNLRRCEERWGLNKASKTVACIEFAQALFFICVEKCRWSRIATRGAKGGGRRGVPFGPMDGYDSAVEGAADAGMDDMQDIEDNLDERIEDTQSTLDKWKEDLHGIPGGPPQPSKAPGSVADRPRGINCVYLCAEIVEVTDKECIYGSCAPVNPTCPETTEPFRWRHYGCPERCPKPAEFQKYV